MRPHTMRDQPRHLDQVPWLSIGGAPLGLTDIFLAVITCLILRIIYLVFRIERVCQAKGRRMPLPLVKGVMTSADALNPEEERRKTGDNDDSARTRYARAHTLDSDALAQCLQTPPLRRSITLGTIERAAVERELVESRRVAMPKRRSSRGSLLTQSQPERIANLPSPKATSEGEPEADPEMPPDLGLESLDVLPLTTPEEAPLLIRMRIELAADLETCPQYDDVTGDIRLLRFLRGYKHSVSQACIAYRAMLATRMQHDVDAIRRQVLARSLSAEDMPHGAEIYPFYPIQLDCGQSKHGHLVSVDPVGQLRLREVMREVGPEKMFEFMIGVSELRQIIMDEVSVESGHLVQSVQVKDLHGLSMSMLKDPKAVSTLQAIISTCTSMYPESLACVYIINAPFFFPMVWTVISRFINERTQRKVRVLGRDYEETLREEISDDVVQVIRDLHTDAR